ncbi:MAG: acetyl-CoA carboxylase biotin carboxyl carrier protein, partial [Rhodothermales bacterium]
NQSSPPAPSPPPIAEPKEERKAANEVVVKAPIVGTFYRLPAPDEESFVNVGDEVAAGDVLCIIEAMKLMNEIESDVNGIVRKILVENAQAVEYDQPLFVIETA